MSKPVDLGGNFYSVRAPVSTFVSISDRSEHIYSLFRSFPDRNLVAKRFITLNFASEGQIRCILSTECGMVNQRRDASSRFEYDALYDSLDACDQLISEMSNTT